MNKRWSGFISACILTQILILSSCSFGNSDMDNSDKSSFSGSYKKEETAEALKTLNADIIAYEEGSLEFEVNGTFYKASMNSSSFKNDIKISEHKTVSELIIKRAHQGKKISGDVTVNEEMNKVISCDVITPNGQAFSSTMIGETKPDRPDSDYDYSIKRVKGSIFFISNCNYSFTADLNELDNFYKADFPDSCEKVAFSGYMFNDGDFIIKDLSLYEGTDSDGAVNYTAPDNSDHFHFFGTIISLSDERAVVRLTDNKTTCDVPTYYNDGELKEGMQIMLTLNADASLFGSGRQYKSDFAVLHTSPDEYNYMNYDFNELAYAKYSKININDYVYTKAGDI